MVLDIVKKAKLFETADINGLELTNRFVRSATWTGMAEENGTCTARLQETMVQLINGGVGLIITGQSYAYKRGQAGPRQLAIDRDSRIARLCRLTDAIHEHRGKIIIQLSHAGIYGASKISVLSHLLLVPDKNRI